MSSPAALVVPAAQGDVDGDGEPDVIRYDGDMAVVTLSTTGQAVRASVKADIEGDEPATAGVEDLDRDGRAEIFVQVGRGASTAFVLALRFDGTRLAALTVAGQPLLLGIGGSATHGDGFRCTDTGSLVVSSAQSDDGDQFNLTEITYRVKGLGLAETDRKTSTARGASSDAVAAAYVVDCRSVGESE